MELEDSFDITEINHWFNIEGFLVILDNEKAFRHLGHDFLSSVVNCLNLNLAKILLRW